MASQIRGHAGQVFIDTSSGVGSIGVDGRELTFTGYASTWTLDQSVDSFETTSFGDSYKTAVSGLPRNKLTVEFECSDVNWNTTSGAQSETTTTKEQPKKMQLFEYAVIYVPQDDGGKVDKKKSSVLVGPSTKLATNRKSVENAALREFDDTDLDLDFVTVLVRPFDDDL